MDGYVGDQHQIPVNVQQTGLDALVGFDQHAAGNAQGTVQPGGDEHAAVALRSQAGVGAGQFTVFLDLEGGTVQMGCAHHEAAGLLALLKDRDLEGDEGGAAPDHEILAAGNQVPILMLGEDLISLALHHFYHIKGCVISAGG